MKKLVALALTLILLVSLAPAALAQGAQPSGPKAAPAFAAAPMAFPIRNAIYRNNLTIVASGYVKITIYTQTDMVADLIRNSSDLQRWNGSAWVTYNSLTDSEEITINLETTYYRFVATGNYYRIHSFHYSERGSEYASNALNSPSQYVS